jgi:hypothetical protein
LLADTPSDNRALTSVHVGQNRIPPEEMRKIVTIAMRMDNMKILCEVPFKDKTLTELDVSGKNLGTEGVLVVAGYLDGNGALTKLNASDNGIVGKEGGKILSDMIAHNSVLKELDVSSNCKNYGDDGPGFAKELAIGISDNGAISQFTFSGDSGDSKPVTMETTMTVADFSGKGLGASGAIMLSAFLPKCM